MYRDGQSTYIPVRSLMNCWNEEIPYVKFVAMGKTRDYNVLIMHDGDVLRGYHKRFDKADVIICCHPKTVRDITGDPRIVSGIGDYLIYFTLLHNAIKGYDEMEITAAEYADDEDLNWLRLYAAGLE